MNHLVNWAPFKNTFDLDPFFEEFRKPLHASGRLKHENFTPSAELLEDKEKFSLSIELPGMEQKDINVEVVDNILTISGEKKQKTIQDGKRSSFGRVFYGKFSQSFELPSTIHKDKIDAAFQNGVLEIILPKDTKSSRKLIEVK